MHVLASAFAMPHHSRFRSSLSRSGRPGGVARGKPRMKLTIGLGLLELVSEELAGALEEVVGRRGAVVRRLL